jgi:hypothetical protein
MKCGWGPLNLLPDPNCAICHCPGWGVVGKRVGASANNVSSSCFSVFICC